MPSAEVDSFPMKCKECDIMQKIVKGLKMQIRGFEDFHVLEPDLSIGTEMPNL